MLLLMFIVLFVVNNGVRQNKRDIQNVTCLPWTEPKEPEA